jgi:hypothetical protein
MTIIQWARYALLDPATGEQSEFAAAVACVTVIGSEDPPEVKTYENIAPIENLDDDTLEDYRIEGDAAWQMVGLDSGYYGIFDDDERITIEGQSIIACLAAQEWTPPDEETSTDESYGWF